MKSVSADVKNKLYYEGLPVYSKALLYAKHKTLGTENMFILTPNSFTLENNNIIENGGDGFPIGNCISKQIKISLLNKGNTFWDYDLSTARIILKSVIYPNGMSENPVELSEGTFYAPDVKITNHTINIIAYDSVSILDTTFFIYNAITGSSTPIYATLWDYFVHICDDVYAPLKGFASGTHGYSSHLDSDRFYNSTFSLAPIQPDGSQKKTLRDALGYIAQLACGNIVLDADEKIDIISYDLLNSEYISGMTFNDTVSAYREGGELDDATTGFSDLSGGDLTDDNYILLDNFSTPPTLEYNEVVYDRVMITYHRPSSDDGKAGYPNGGTYNNVLSLENLLCERSSDNDSDVRAAAHRIYAQLGSVNRSIKPFTGSFSCNPLVEFMDNVVVTDIDGTAYNSFVGSHTMNYIGESSISNSTPSPDKNKRYT